MKLLWDLSAILKHADDTIPLARREEQARHSVSGSVCFFALCTACGTSDGMKALSSQRSLMQAKCFSLGTARDVCELLFQITALRLAPKLGWAVVPAA